MTMKKTLIILLLIYSGQLFAQQVLLDRGTNINGIWCFPLHTDANTYLYLPTRARLALDEEEHPKFSFMRYITEKQSDEVSANSITEAGGGGILHFLILYDTPTEQIEKAQELLRENLENKDIKIRGPILFDKGSFVLISSILNKESGKEEKKLLATGEAPVLENSSIALSFDINPLDSKVLLESFKMDTPDISLIFDLTFSGLSDSYDATLEIDWSEVKKSKSFGAGGSYYFIGADVELGFDELIKNNSIKLINNGSNTSMDALLSTVYERLLAVMFKPAESASVPKEQQGSMLDAISSLTDPDGALSSRKTTGFGFNASFQLKQMRIEGKSNLFFKGRSTINRHHFVTFNIGNLYQHYGQDERFFKDVPIWDPAFQQREVFVGIDGDLEKEFENMLNSVTITLRKQHANGTETLADILIQKKSFKNYEGKLSMRYLNQGDTITTDWLNYEYKTNWKFKGGGGYETPWQEENAVMVNLFIPFQRRTIRLEGDLNTLMQKGIRAVSIQINYPFFGETKKQRITIRPNDDLSKKSFEITLPNSIEDVNYKITWIKPEESGLELEGIDKIGMIFIDEIPE